MKSQDSWCVGIFGVGTANHGYPAFFDKDFSGPGKANSDMEVRWDSWCFCIDKKKWNRWTRRWRGLELNLFDWLRELECVSLWRVMSGSAARSVEKSWRETVEHEANFVQAQNREKRRDNHDRSVCTLMINSECFNWLWKFSWSRDAIWYFACCWENELNSLHPTRPENQNKWTTRLKRCRERNRTHNFHNPIDFEQLSASHTESATPLLRPLW